MTGKSSKTKGAAAEREVCHIINEALGTNITRELSQTRDGGNDATLGKYRIECKRQETISLPAWCRQAEASCKEGEVPVVCYRSSRQPWRVVLKLDDWLELLKNQKETADEH